MFLNWPAARTSRGLDGNRKNRLNEEKKKICHRKVILHKDIYTLKEKVPWYSFRSSLTTSTFSLLNFSIWKALWNHKINFQSTRFSHSHPFSSSFNQVLTSASAFRTQVACGIYHICLDRHQRLSIKTQESLCLAILGEIWQPFVASWGIVASPQMILEWLTEAADTAPPILLACVP